MTKTKKVICNILMISAVIIVFLSCTSNSDQNEISIPEGMIALSLKKYGKPFSIAIPDTISTKLSISEESTGDLVIIVGKSFAISVNEQWADLSLLKSDLRGDEVNKFKNFVKEDSTSLIWESGILKPEFHFMLNKKMNGSEYSFHELNDTDAKLFNKQEIERMYNACNNLIAEEKL